MPPTYVIGNLWDELGKADLLLVTTNASFDRYGQLVMGAGAALEAKIRWPFMPIDLGQHLKRIIKNDTHIYGVKIWKKLDGSKTHVGIFQTKTNWRESSSAPIIASSVECLLKIIQSYHRIAMNYPGIGLGNLSRDVVEPLLEQLPAHVFIYSKE